ncbi:MAG: hypothetical protein M3O15_05935 [Acidobacteriota bacterium]|nr:hypothetical protein [Acidobacteriota bacterium]
MDEESQLESAVRELVDQLVPENMDWERLVRTYPLPSIALAGLGGFLLGRSQGPVILSAIGSFAASEVARNVSRLIDPETD